MTDTEKKIAEVGEALKNCTFPDNERLIFVESEEDETTYEIVTERGVVIAKGLDPYDAYFFANAPQWLRFLMSERDAWVRQAVYWQQEERRVRLKLQSAQQEIERLRGELEDERRHREFEKMQNDELRDLVQKLIDGLRRYAHMLSDKGQRARDILKEIGVTASD